MLKIHTSCYSTKIRYNDSDLSGVLLLKLRILIATGECERFIYFGCRLSTSFFKN